jgi:dipeptidyl aminopeptidase/acylaminoacyl peptidase
MTRSIRWRIVAAILLATVCVPAAAAAQYFGRNKVQYRTFDFQVLHTEHFDLYYYPEEADATQIVARLAERWHARLSRFFGHELRGRQVVILYAVGAHFRQTNAIEGLIGEGTGGVTEGMRRRIVLPISGSLADTDHVLGHELVHAFQFDLTGEDPRESTGQAPGILAYPLWFVEGMAEYLSLGPLDAQTAMWLRDAALREKLPGIRDLDSPKYFPYRWGHAFWAYVGAKYGDRAVASLVRSAANPRFDLAGLTRQLGTDPDTFTKDWHAAITAATQEVLDAQSPVTSQARLVIGHASGGGEYNIGPRVSPDGSQIAFFSERDRFSIDLYLMDAATGRIRRKLVTSATDPHFDSLQFLNSAGAWSPDGRTLAMAAIRGGRPILAFVDVAHGRIQRELRLRGLDDVLNPSYAPDGKSLVISGNRGGLIDLYRVTIATGALDRLTADPYADLEGTFTPDGRSIVFVTERFSTDLESLEPGPLRLAKLDLATKTVTPLVAFLRGKHLSPSVSPDGRFVTFIADPDGVSNLYRIGIDGGSVEQLSSVPTGIAGITSSSPALSASAATGRLVYSVFEDDGYAIYALDPADTVALVPPDASSLAAVLPGRSRPGGDVQALLTNYTRGLPPEGATTTSERYRHNLSLDFLGQPTISGSIGAFGSRVSGGMAAVFSDMLGDRGLSLQGQIGGSLADFGGQIAYLNRRHRWNWAAAFAATPWAIGYLTRIDDPASETTAIQAIIERQTSIGPILTAAYPFNASTRFEVTGSAERLTFTRETRTGTYAAGRLVDFERQHETIGRPLNLAHASAAIVRDTSYYGATSPIYGSRSRFEIGQTSGTLGYTSLLLDYRRYFMPVRPWTIAVRALHYGRYGRDSEADEIIDLYSGYPELVHGYGVGSFSATECLQGAPGQDCDVFRSLLGSRMLVANIEVHVPVPGVFHHEIEYGRLPVDLAFFTDAGVTWTRDDLPSFAGGNRRIVRSIGGALRVNVFGLLAVELAASHPFDRVDRSMQWQVGIRQGF